MELDNNAHSVFLLYYHLVLVVKYSMIVFLHYNITLQEWNHEKDHIHILFKAHPKSEISKFINAYKSASSRLVKKEFAQIRQKLWMEKSSNNRNKQRIKVAKLHEKVANQRKDFLHKQSKQITNVYDCICIENLDMKAMARSLNFGKFVADNGWSMFVTFLQYKLEEKGKQLVKVDKFFASSQNCNRCGYKNPDMKNLSVRTWDCPECGTHHDRDVNAAINIRNEGLRLVTA